jgi:hypothetical protein
MNKYKICGTLGGGFGGLEMKDDDDWVVVHARSKQEAMEMAENMAREEFEMYMGAGNGIRDLDEVMEDEGVDKEEAERILDEEFESWADFDAIKIE